MLSQGGIKPKPSFWGTSSVAGSQCSCSQWNGILDELPDRSCSILRGFSFELTERCSVGTSCRTQRTDQVSLGCSILMRGRYPSHRAEDANVKIGPCQIRDVLRLGTLCGAGGAEGLNDTGPPLHTWSTVESEKIPKLGEKQGRRQIPAGNTQERVSSTLLKKL